MIPRYSGIYSSIKKNTINISNERIDYFYKTMAYALDYIEGYSVYFLSSVNHEVLATIQYFKEYLSFAKYKNHSNSENPIPKVIEHLERLYEVLSAVSDENRQYSEDELSNVDHPYYFGTKNK